MAGIEQMRLRNREVSILFMQQEHASTLKDLHDEIQRLQQKCSDEYREKCSKLEAQVRDQKKDIEEKHCNLEKKEIRIQNLEEKLRAVEKKYKDELKQRHQLVQKLQADLLEKSDQIAQLQIAPLTSRTHQYGVETLDMTSSNLGTFSASKNRHAVDQYLDTNLVSGRPPIRAIHAGTHEHRLSRESSNSSHNSQEDINVNIASFAPIPPSGRPGSGGSIPNVRSRRRMTTAQTTPHFAEVMVRPASAKKLDKFGAPVDTEEILQIAREQRVSLKLPHGTGPVIPPIKPKVQGIAADPQRVTARQTNSASFKKKASRSSKNATAKVEVETLAIDQLINTDLRKAQEFNSYASDT